MTNKHVTLDWILILISSGDVAPFYNTREWNDLREKKRKAEHNECERCRARFVYTRGETVHHKKYLRQFPQLAMSYDNLELLCKECHYKEHHAPRFEERW